VLAERATADDTAAIRPANIEGLAGSRAPVASTSADPVAGDIAKNQRIMPMSSTAAEVNSISGKRSINGYPQLIAISLIPPNADACSRK
jgi:hypothetical protein